MFTTYQYLFKFQYAFYLLEYNQKAVNYLRHAFISFSTEIIIGFSKN